MSLTSKDPAGTVWSLHLLFIYKILWFIFLLNKKWAESYNVSKHGWRVTTGSRRLAVALPSARCRLCWFWSLVHENFKFSAMFLPEWLKGINDEATNHDTKRVTVTQASRSVTVGLWKKEMMSECDPCCGRGRGRGEVEQVIWWRGG